MLVTVYITTYNRLELLKRAITSVQKQTYKSIEIIVADDGSTDGTQDYLLKQQQLGLLKCCINTSGASKGACYGRNRAIEIASGEFITGLDDDDYFEPWRVQSFIDKWKELEKAGVEFVGLFDSCVEYRKYGVVKCYETPVVSYNDLRMGNLIGNQVFAKKTGFERAGGFDEKMPALQDWDTWLRMSKSFGGFYNCQTYSYIQIHNHGGVRISEKPEYKVRAAFKRLSEKLEPMSKSEKVQLLYTLTGYNQVVPAFSELVQLGLALKIRRIAQIVKRQIIKK